MRRAVFVLHLLAALGLVMPAPLASARSSGATVTLERRIPAADPPPVAELVQAVLEFEPGAWTAGHRHNGPSYNTVLEGRVTLRMGDLERTFAAGDGWVDDPGVPHAAGNRGATPARLLATFVVARGTPPSTFVEPEEEGDPPPEPTVVAFDATTVVGLAGPLDVIHRVVDIAPGSTIPARAQAGPSIVSVLEGGVSVDLGGEAHGVAHGDSWVEPAGLAHGYTVGDATARVVTTTVAPRDRPLGTPAGGASAAPVQVPR